MIVNNVDGLAISVKEPTGQTTDINAWCKDLKVITVDSDAPDSDRLYYIGTDNVAAGKQAGELLAAAAPEGGKVMIFVGDLTQANANERAQGVINALLGQD
jgi:ribose transport system substrate-binding protein